MHLGPGLPPCLLIHPALAPCLWCGSPCARGTPSTRWSRLSGLVHADAGTPSSIKDVAQGMRWPIRIHPRLHAKPFSQTVRLVRGSSPVSFSRPRDLTLFVFPEVGVGLVTRVDCLHLPRVGHGVGVAPAELHLLPAFVPRHRARGVSEMDWRGPFCHASGASQRGGSIDADGWRCSSCRRECIPGSILLNDIHRLL